MKRYELYDGRFPLSPPRSTCLYSANSLEEAITSINDFGTDTCLVQIDEETYAETLLYALTGSYADIDIVRASVMAQIGK